MKKENIKKALCVAVLFALWIIPCFELKIYPKTYVYFAAFVPSVAIMYIFKKEWISYLITAVITFAASIYNYEYLFLVFPVVLLSYAHFSASRTEEKKDDSFNTSNNCTTLSFILIAGEIFYSFIQYNKIEVHRMENLLTAMKMAPLFIVLFAILAIQSRKKQNYKVIHKKKADKYTMIYLTSLFGVVVSLLAFYALNDYSVQSVRTEYIFWFVYIITMVFNGDPYIEITLRHFKERTENIKTNIK